jgi:hypothetical protein
LGGGQAAGNCKNYAAQYSLQDKKDINLGWNPTCVLDDAYHEGYGRCKQFRWTHLVAVGKECVETTSWVSVPCGSEADPTALSAVPTSGPCQGKITSLSIDETSFYKSFNHFPVNTGRQDCFVPAPDNLVCLYNQGTTDILFDQFSSYGPRGFSDLICIFALISLTFYFVTSSDSGSLVVDMISANGHPEPPTVQRIFWSFVEGGTAAALLYSGKNLPNSEGSLRALQSASMIAGLPYTFILFWCSHSLLLLVKEEAGDLKQDRKAFGTFILNLENMPGVIVNTVLPGLSVGRIIERVGGWPLHSRNPKLANLVWSCLFQSLWLLIVVFLFCGLALKQWVIVALVLYIGFCTLLGFLRTHVRNVCRITNGDMITDFQCAFFVPMFAITQMEAEKIEAPIKMKDEDSYRVAANPYSPSTTEAHVESLVIQMERRIEALFDSKKDQLSNELAKIEAI